MQQPGFDLPQPRLDAAEKAEIREIWSLGADGQKSLLDRLTFFPRMAREGVRALQLGACLEALLLTAEEETSLWKWGTQAGRTAGLDPRDPISSASLAFALMTERCTGGAPRGEATFAALGEFGVVPEFTTRMTRFLRDEMKRPLSPSVHFHFDGHLTPEIVSLFASLENLGLAQGSITRSTVSGVEPIPRMLESRLSPPWRAPFLPPAVDEQDGIIDRLRSVVDRGDIFIMDKVKEVLNMDAPPRERERLLTSDRVRHIIHNRSDRDALDQLPKHVRDRLWGADLSNSRLKAFEADLIAEQAILEAARRMREFLGAKLMDVPVVIVGHGLIGSAISNALEGLGYPRDQIYVRDIDPAAVEGWQSADELEQPLQDAVVFVATPSRQVDAALLERLAKRSFVLSLTSKSGVDLDSIEQRSDQPSRMVGMRAGGWNPKHGPSHPTVFTDELYQLDGAETVVLRGGRQVNLIEPTWWDRHAIATGGGGGVCMALLMAARAKKPGIIDPRTDPDWRRWEDEALAQARALGMDRIRPLSDDPAYAEELAEDLRQFPNVESYRSFNLR